MIKFETIGADPEFFVLDPKGKPYPATKFAVGSKESPSPIGDGFFEQRDNVSFEGNIPPVSTKEEFIKNITRLRQYFIDKVSKFGYSISPNGVEYFEKRYLLTAEAKEFGCSSVISSWDSYINYLQKRPTPNLGNLKFRVSGFHIHCGYSSINILKSRGTIDILIGRLFDLFVTMPSHSIKPEPERITTYGKFGMIRCKSYGVECRTLSTYFTQEDQLSWVWDQVMKIEQFINACDPDDLKYLVKNRHFIGSSIPGVKRIFNGIFSNLTEGH